MQIAVSTYSFQRLLSKGTDLPACIRMAKEMGFDGIEIAGLPVEDSHETKAAYAREIAGLCQSLQLPVVNYTIGADLLGNDLAGEVDRLKKEVDIACLLGAAGMRHDAAWGLPQDMENYKTFEDVLPRLADGCRQVTTYGAQKGIRTMIENHGLFCQDSQRVEKLVAAVSHPNFGLLLDMGNFLCVDESPALAIGRCARYAAYVHAKDFIWKSGMEYAPGDGFFRTRAGHYLRGTIIGHGVVPIVPCLTTLKAAGYTGYIGLEFEGLEEVPEALAIGLRNLRRFLDM